jgi:hypothetical protein
MKENDIHAFPNPSILGYDKDGKSLYEGMSLRDWFAGLAMNTLITRQIDYTADKNTQKFAMPYVYEAAKHLAKDAYCFADAMLEARGKE